MSPVLYGADRDGERICLLHLALGTYFNSKSYPFAVGLLFDEAKVLKVPENPVVSMADSYRPLR